MAPVHAPEKSAAARTRVERLTMPFLSQWPGGGRRVYVVFRPARAGKPLNTMFETGRDAVLVSGPARSADSKGMNQANPYRAPRADVDVEPVVTEGLGEIASGQKLLVRAILVNVCSWGLRVWLGERWGLVSIVAIVMSLLGIVRLATGMRYGTVKKVLLLVAMFIPLVNLMVLLSLNSRATVRLRAAGYRIGLLGASR
jgi:hypothetical protein